ncbi:MAG: hypothetical protein FWE10_03880 [Rikenellaceae bacterium]|nr:hypothetical protein [Rikenellaceae bacterium]MCL2693423.1 hypothetical protein [Rikenellaceae bacterium]
MKPKHFFKWVLILPVIIFSLMSVFARISEQVLPISDTTSVGRGVLAPPVELLDSLERMGIEFIEMDGSMQGAMGMAPMSTGFDDDDFFIPSPNASALIRAINNPVNLATGTVSMQVPLYTLQAGAIQVPLALSYQATGIQVGQKASNVGLGWRLSGTPQITRVVKGRPDEQLGIIGKITHTTTTPGNPFPIVTTTSLRLGGWCNNWPFTNEFDVYRWYSKTWYTNIAGYFNTTKDNEKFDSEPDLFYFEIPGKGGMFIFDHSGNAHTIPYQNIDIRWHRNPNDDFDSYFEIIDEDGTIYIFGNTNNSKEATSVVYDDEKQDDISCITTWYVNKIENIRGDVVTFEYVTGQKIEYINFGESYVYLRKSNTANFFTGNDLRKNQNSTVTIASPRYLSKITGPTTEITFHRNTRPSGQSQQYTHLIVNNINVSAQLAHTKQINLTYGTFQNGEPRLTGVDEVVSGKPPQNLFSFTYYDENAAFPSPHTKTYKIDLWGYWSSTASNTTLMPSIYYWRTAHNRHDNISTTSLTASPNGSYQRYLRPNSGLASPHFSTTGYAAQANDYVVQAPWALSPSLALDDEYDYDTYWQHYVNNQPYSWTSPTGGSFRHANLNDTRTYTLRRITYPTGGYTEYDYELNQHTHKGNTPRGTDKTYAAGGLRIKSVTQHDGISASTVNYQYDQGIALRDVRDEYFYTFSETGTGSNWHEVMFISSNPVLSPTDLGGSHVIYPRVTQVNPDGSRIISEFTTPALSAYLFDDRPMYAVINSNTRAFVAGFGPQSEKLNSRHYLRGLPIREEIRDPSNNIVSTTEYSYRVGKPMGTVKAYRPVTLPRHPMVFVFQYISQAVVPNKITTTSKYGPTTTTDFTYNTANITDYRPREIKTTVSGGTGNTEVVTQQIKYSNEYTVSPIIISGEAGGIAALQSRYAVVPIEVVTRKNVWGVQKVVAAEITSFQPLPPLAGNRRAIPYVRYAIPANVPLASFTPSTISSNSFVKDPQYEEIGRTERYDDRGNPVHTTTPFGNERVYVYGYNGTLLIAEVEIPGSIFSCTDDWMVYYNNFEDLNAGAGVTGMPFAKTGRHAWQGDYSISLAPLRPGDYVLTYWRTTNAGLTWIKHTKPVTVDNGITSSEVISNPYPGFIDELRLIPVGARIKTYSYIPGVGITSESDHNGVTRYWEYDAFGRVIKMLDNERRVLEEYEYNIKN